MCEKVCMCTLVSFSCEGYSAAQPSGSGLQVDFESVFGTNAAGGNSSNVDGENHKKDQSVSKGQND